MNGLHESLRTANGLMPLEAYEALHEADHTRAPAQTQIREHWFVLNVCSPDEFSRYIYDEFVCVDGRKDHASGK